MTDASQRSAWVSSPPPLPSLTRPKAPPSSAASPSALPPSVDHDISRLVSAVQHTWRTSTENEVRENLVKLALMITPDAVTLNADDNHNPLLLSIKRHVQKGLFLILQKHYAAYKKQGDNVYAGFAKKFEILLDLMPLTFQSKASEEAASSTLQTPFGDDNDDEGIEVLIHLYQTTLDRHVRLIVPVLQGLQHLSLSAQAKAKILQMTLHRLPRIQVDQIPAVLRLIGEYPADDMESLQTVSTVRQLWGRLEQPHDDARGCAREVRLAGAQAVVQWFARAWNGHFLATAYLHAVDESTESPPPFPDPQQQRQYQGMLVLDMIVLLSLSSDVDFSEQAQQIMDSWVDLSGYFSALYRTIFLLKMNDRPSVTLETSDTEFWQFCQSFVSPLTNLAIRLLGNISNDTDRVHDFCLKLFHHFLLDGDRPLFVDSVVHLWNSLHEEGNCETPGAIHQVMESLARQAPEMMRWNRDLFMHVLELSAIETNRPTTESISTILVTLFDNEEQDELLDLVDRLLFGPADARVDGRTTNGVILATEIIRLPNCDVAKLNQLKSRVLTVLLPANRRTVPPDLGSAGLAFLEVCGLKQSLPVFPDIQMILANTGLIQRLSTYKEAKRKYEPILGYASKDKPDEEQPTFIFCAAFFLRRVNCAEIKQWDSNVRWVFDLVDVYLANGRKRSRTAWNPRGWLQAVVEFPSIEFPFKPKGAQQKNAAKWFLEDFANFDINLPGNCPPPANFRNLCTDMFLREPLAITRLHATLLQFSLGLFVGLGISAAVLKNSFAYYRDIQKPVKKARMLRMIEGQIMKIYHLKDKIVSLESVLVTVEGALRKMENEPTLVAENEIPTEGLPKSDDIARLKEIVGILSETIFCTPVFIDDAILWECLTDTHSTEILCNHVKLSLSMDTSSAIVASKDEVVKSMESKFRVVSQLICTGGSSVSDIHLHLVQLASLMFFLVTAFPKLRAALSDMDRPPLSSWVRYTATITQLLTLCFRQQMERTHRVDDIVRTLSASMPVSSETRRRDDVSRVVQGLKQLLSGTDDVHVAGSLLDILAILGHAKPVVLDTVIQSSNEVIRKSFAKSSLPTSIATLPYSVSVLAHSLKAPAKAMATFRKALDATVCRKSAGPGRPTDSSYWVYRYPLLHQFGLLVQNRSSAIGIETFQNELSIELESVLDWMENRSEKTPRKGKITDSASSNKSKKYASSMQGLTGSTVADFFETSLHIAIGIIVIYPPTFVIPRQKTPLSPYRRLEGFLRSVHRLAQMYATYYRHFPRRTVSCIYTTARNLLELMEVQINRCVDWRNSHPLPKPGALYDPGSVVFLGELVRSCRKLILGCLGKIVERWNADGAPQISAKGKTLQQSMERFSQNLNDLCAVQGLSACAEDDRQDSTIQGIMAATPTDNKRRRVALPPVLYHATSTDQASHHDTSETCDMNDEDDMDGDYVGNDGFDDDNDDSDIDGGCDEDEDESFVQWGRVGDDGKGADEDSVCSMEAITIQRVS